ncbi:hypothetical protein DSO57_1003823 [Entomophthora muscae]|uniref:Uncharacterized protein n=1 Tax=Entomophthora muscae TaxID=34485 RepID=A0ACC2UT65_9FUNG|nr:hypothetical protein DSO57_1003823 [Entomophthora muscae]
MPRSSQLSVWAQDCDTTVAGSESSTITHVEGEEENDSIFVETKDLHNWTNNIVLNTTSSPLATPSALLPACHNSKELPSAYLSIINWFGALFAKDNTVTQIQLGACYHSSYDMEQLIREVELCLHITAKDISGLSSQNT